VLLSDWIEDLDEVASSQQKALEAVAQAIALDPLSASSWSTLGALQVARGRGDEGERSLARALEVDPRFRTTSWETSGGTMAFARGSASWEPGSPSCSAYCRVR